MITLTKTEIKWILRLVKSERENSKSLMNIPGQQFAALHKLEYENMDSLAGKLEKTLDSKAKRIAVGGVV